MTVPRRRRLAVEVIQSSAMDCGPAALKCLLDSHGIPVSYGRLREACQTEVDGTSIDTLEEVAVQLGLDAEQNLIPTDHLFVREAQALPAIAIVRSPGGLTHFVIVWSHAAGLVQIMDPAVGRQFVARDAFLRRLFVHRMPVPREALREWLGSDEFQAPLRRRAAALGVPTDRTTAWISHAAADPDLLSLARLDAAVRMASSLVDADALARGSEAARFIHQLLADTETLTGPPLYAVLPESFFTAVPAPDDPDTGLLRGAVIVRVRGVRPDAPSLQEPSDMSPGTLPAGLAAALREPQVAPLRRLAALVRADGLAAPSLLALGLLAAAATVVAEALVLRAFVDVGARIGVGEQRLGAAAAIVLFFALLVLLELPIAAYVQRIGRRLGARLRLAFLTRIPQLGDRYLASRPISDMAERAHHGHVLRAAPDVAARLLRGACELVFTAAALIWLDPIGAPWIALAAAIVVAVPLALLPTLGERTLKVHSHVGALGRFYFDALLGLAAIRTHAAERSLLREHEAMLVEWSHAQRHLFRVQVLVTGITATVGLALAGALFLAYVARHAEPTGALLLLYWALALPQIGERIADAAFELPALRVTAIRLLEPLLASPEPSEPPAAARPLTGDTGVALAFTGVHLIAGGHTILHDLDLEIPPGQHVAIVGPSGAGKSSLLALLLGWHRPAAGTITVDGRALDDPTLTALRQVTAWVDPAVQLWNDTLLANLHYGNTEAHQRLPDTIDRADLTHVLERLQGGLQAVLGEGGGLVSGGEGQRVRLGRALLRDRPRLVLLDEPFRGLDRAAREAQLARVRAHWRGCTLLCVTHDIDVAVDFDRVLVIDGGAVVEDNLTTDLSRETASKFTALLRSEAALRETGWNDPAWRRLRLDDGALHKAAAR